MSRYACLRSWSFGALRVRLNVATGQVRLAVRRGRPVSGQAWMSRGIWYALRVEEDGGLVLQAGRRVWRIGSDARAEVVRGDGAARRFRLRAGAETLEVRYASPADRWWRRAGLGRSGEASDFFVMVANVVNDPKIQEFVVERWCPRRRPELIPAHTPVHHTPAPAR